MTTESKKLERQKVLDELQELWVNISEATKQTILNWKDAMISDEELQRRKEAGELTRDHEKNPTS